MGVESPATKLTFHLANNAAPLHALGVWERIPLIKLGCSEDAHAYSCMPALTLAAAHYNNM